MANLNDADNTGPVFKRPEGTSHYGEEPTLPYVDLYSQSDKEGGATPYGSSEGQWNPGPYGVGPHGDDSNRSQPYADPQYGPIPQQQSMAVPPRQAQQYWSQYPYAQPEHPQATTVLVLAVVGFALPVTAFIAWYMGGKAKAEIEQGAPFTYTGTLKTGHIIGKVLSIITIVSVALTVLFTIIYIIGVIGFLRY